MLSASGALDGLGSPSKRKRDASADGRLQFRARAEQGRRLRTSASASAASVCRLSAQGALLIADSGRAVVLSDVARVARPVETTLSAEHDFSAHICMHTAQDASTYVASCSATGLLVVSRIDAAHAVHTSTQLVLQSDETITAMCVAEHHYVLCSSHNSVLLVHARGSHLSERRLAPKPTLIGGFIQTGFKLFGLSTEVALDPSMRVFSVLPVPGTRWLLVFGGVLSLWSDWMDEGGERVAWDAGLREQLSTVADEPAMHEARLLSTAFNATSATVVVALSAGTSDHRAALLVVLALCLGPSARPVTLLSKLTLDAAATPDPVALHVSGASLFACWVSTASRSLHVLHLASATTSDVDLSSVAYLADTDVKASDVRALAAVQGVEGLALIAADLVYSCLKPVTLEDARRKLEAASKPVDASVRDMLRQLSAGELPCTDAVLAQLRIRVQQLGAQEQRVVLRAASVSIVDRPPLGTHWGASAEPSKELLFRQCLKHAREKLTEHRLLTDAVSRLGVDEACLTEVMGDHQDMGVCALLCESLADTAMRAKAADSDAFLARSYRGCVALFDTGMREHVLESQVTEAHMARSGLTVADVFFSKATLARQALLCVSRAVLAAGEVAARLRGSPSPSRLGEGRGAVDLLSSAYGVLAALVGSLAGVAEPTFPGATSEAAALSSSEVRTAMRNVLTCMALSLDALAYEHPTLATPAQVSLHLENAGLRMGKEGARVRDFAVLLLDGYTRDWVKSNVGEGKLTQFERGFEEAKQLSVALVLRMGHVKTAYQLSVQFMYFHGLLESFEQSAGDESIRNDFQRLVAARGREVSTAAASNGVDKTSLSEFSMQYLWMRKHYAVLLDLSRFMDQTVVQQFMADKPSLSWLLAFDKKDFTGAAAQLSALSGAVENTGTAASIAKLCGRLVRAPPASATH